MRLLLGLKSDPSLANDHHSMPLLTTAGVGGARRRRRSRGNGRRGRRSREVAAGTRCHINAGDDNGETVWHGAAYQSFPKLVQLLSDRHADMSVWKRENK